MHATERLGAGFIERDITRKNEELFLVYLKADQVRADLWQRAARLAILVYLKADQVRADLCQRAARLATQWNKLRRRAKFVQMYR
jgi:hypothetical protein